MAGYPSVYGSVYPPAAGGVPFAPGFSAGSPSVGNLSNLSYAVRFLVDNDLRPTWNLFKTTTQSIAANTWTSVIYDHTAFDSDGVRAYPGVTIVTQGRYKLEACVQIEATSTKDAFSAAFLFTAGANNPNATAGTLKYFGFRGCGTSITGSGAADNAICISDLANVVFYPGDVIDVQVCVGATHTLDYNQNTSYTQGRFVTKFTGAWCYKA